MKSDTNRRRYSRRSLLALAGATSATALAGCVGGTSSGTERSPEDDPDTTTTGTAGTTTVTTTEEADAGGNAETTATPAYDCDSLLGDPTEFEAPSPDFPFPFTFDYPAHWEQTGVTDRRQRVDVSFGVFNTDGGTLNDFTMRLEIDPRPRDKKSLHRWAKGLDSEPIEVAYGDETLPMYPLHNAEVGFTNWRFYVPAGEENDFRGYHQAQLTVKSYVDAGCPEARYRISEDLLRSIRPLAEPE